jgi:hypothetical protein
LRQKYQYIYIYIFFFLVPRNVRAFLNLLEHHYFLAVVFNTRLAVRKQTTCRVHMERYNLKKLREVEGKEQYRVEISNRFAALENLDTDVDINRAWKNK